MLPVRLPSLETAIMVYLIDMALGVLVLGVMVMVKVGRQQERPGE